MVCPTSSFFTNIVIESSWMGAIWRPSGIRRGWSKLLCARLCTYFGIHPSPKYIAKPTGTYLRFNEIWGSITSTMLSSTMHLVLSCVLSVEQCVFSKNIGMNENLIFGNRPWKLLMRGVCIGRWQWHHSASDRTPNSSEPQICTSGFSTAIWLRLDAKIDDKHKAWQTVT